MVGVKLEGSSEPGTELHLLNIGRGLVTAVHVLLPVEPMVCWECQVYWSRSTR